MSNQETSKYSNYIDKIPDEFIKYASYLIELMETKYQIIVRDVSIVLIADHLAFAYERFHKGIKIPNLFLSEIKMLYATEFAIAEEFLEYLHATSKVRLPDDEIGYIANHIINARILDNDLVLKNEVDLVLEKVSILLKNIMDVEIDNSSHEYIRMANHFKFMISRIMQNNQDTDLLSSLKDVYDTIINIDHRLGDVISGISFYIDNHFEYCIC